MQSFLFFYFFFLTKIEFSDFFQQYINFGSTIGKTRLSNYNFSLLNEVIKFKFISFFLLVLILVLIKLKIKNLLNFREFITIIISICFSILLLFHQIISMNQNFIFFLIPFLCGVAHVYYKKVFHLNYFLALLISVCIISVGKYHLRFNEERKFNELENIDLSIAVDANMIDKKLRGLKWITYLNPDDPKKEINNLKKAINIFLNDSSNKMLITEYQVISPIIDIYDNSPNQWHHPSVSFPLRGNNFYNIYQSYFISKIKEKKIETIYETREDEKIITELILNKKCFKKERVGKMLIKIDLNFTCIDLK